MRKLEVAFLACSTSDITVDLDPTTAAHFMNYRAMNSRGRDRKCGARSDSCCWKMIENEGIEMQLNGRPIGTVEWTVTDR